MGLRGCKITELRKNVFDNVNPVRKGICLRIQQKKLGLIYEGNSQKHSRKQNKGIIPIYMPKVAFRARYDGYSTYSTILIKPSMFRYSSIYAVVSKTKRT